MESLDFGEPKQNGFGYPMPLVEKYQPRKIEEFIGLEGPKREIVRKPSQSPEAGGCPAGRPSRLRKNDLGNGLRRRTPRNPSPYQQPEV
jgi:hypothetical protein